MTDVEDASEVLTGQALPPGYGSVNPFVAVRGSGGARHSSDSPKPCSAPGRRLPPTPSMQTVC